MTDRQRLIKLFGELASYSLTQINNVNERDLNTNGTLCSGQIRGLKNSLPYIETTIKSIQEIADTYTDKEN